MQTVKDFLTNPTPTLTAPDHANPIVLPPASTVAGSPPPMPAAVKAQVWDNAQNAIGPNPIRQLFATPRNRNSV